MKLLVTGSSGRLGSPLVAHFARAGHDIVAYDLCEPKAELPSNVSFVQGDLRDRNTLASAAEGIDAVIHLGAIPGREPDMDQAELFEINVQGTFNTLQAAQRGGATIALYSSSLCAIGLPNGCDDHALAYLPVDESHPCQPMHTYDLTKLLGEQVAASFTRLHGLPTICFRFPLLVNALTDDWFYKRVLHDPPPLVMVDYLDYTDAIRAIEMGLARPDLGHEVFFVQATTAATSMRMSDYIKRWTPAVPWQGDTLTDTSPLINAAKIKDVLGFEPAITWQQAGR